MMLRLRPRSWGFADQVDYPKQGAVAGIGTLRNRGRRMDKRDQLEVVGGSLEVERALGLMLKSILKSTGRTRLINSQGLCPLLAA